MTTASPADPSGEEAERELLGRIAAGDREAMRELYFTYHPRVGRLFAGMRAQRRAAMRLSGSPAQHEAPAESAFTADRVGRALTEVPERQRAVVELAYGLGLSCEEIATVMRIPVSSVKTRMFHARRRLDAALLRREAPPGDRLTGHDRQVSVSHGAIRPEDRPV